MPFLGHLEDYIHGMLYRIEKLKSKEAVDNKGDHAYTLVRNQVFQFVGDTGGYRREKIYQFGKQIMIKILIATQHVTEKSNNEKTERYQRHNQKIGNRRSEVKTLVPEKSFQTIAERPEYIHFFLYL